MKLSDFPILTDENIQIEFIQHLRTNGFAVKDVKEEGLEGSTDAELLSLASKENRIVFSHDSDFGRLIFTKPLDFIGIIYLRPGHFDVTFTIQSWNALVKANLDFLPPFLVVVENKGASVHIRYRQM